MADRSRRSRWLRRSLLGVGILVLLAALGAGGAYVWLSCTLSKAHDQPGIEEAREALRESVSTSNQMTTTVAAVTSTSPDAGPGGSSSASTTSATITTTLFDPGAPGGMNILLLGADKRDSSGEAYGRSDTMMLVHVDPDRGYLSILSLPRDLRVDMGKYGIQKLNAAYALGGDALAIRTIRQVLGVKIDHYMRVDFKGFQAAIDKLGGVYVDVDRRYYDNGEKLLRIDLQPGYQRLGGDAALRYVRTRHDLDHDWARIQRQQNFLRAAKGQVFSWDKATKVAAAISTLMDYVATEIGALDALKLAWWLVHLDMSRIKQVVLSGSDQTIDGLAFVVSTGAQVNAAVKDLLTPPEEKQTATTGDGDLGPRSNKIDLGEIRVEVRDGGAGGEKAAAIVAFLRGKGASVTATSGTAAASGIAAASGPAAGAFAGESTVLYPAQMEHSRVVEAAQVAQALGIRRLVEDNDLSRVVVLVTANAAVPGSSQTLEDVELAQWRYLEQQAGFPAEIPGWLPPGCRYAGSRAYTIDTDSGAGAAIAMSYRLASGEQYLGLVQTTFLEPPAALPGEEVVEGGTVFTIVGAVDAVERIWWKRDGVLHWVSNTLASALSRAQLLKVATSMAAVE
ncbi:MAG: LCP family protein [bacterium]